MSVVRRVPFLLASFPGSLFSAFETSEKVKRQRARRLGRRIVTLGIVLMFVSSTGWPQEPLRSGPTVTLAIEFSLPDGSVFYIPTVGDGEMLGMVPLPDGRFAGIRIT